MGKVTSGTAQILVRNEDKLVMRAFETTDTITMNGAGVDPAITVVDNSGNDVMIWAIGQEKNLGSIEPGKKADIVLLGLDYTHFQPIRNVVSAIVYQAQGFEVDTVICNGKIVMKDRVVEGISVNYPDLYEQAADAADAVIKRTGLEKIVLANRPWKSVGHVER